MQKICLSGPWRVSKDLGVQAKANKPGYDDSGWLPVRVPGHWQDVPQLTDNTEPLLYRRTFQLEEVPPPGASARLRFDGVFYYAQAWVNGRFVGEHQGYFDPAAFEVAPRLVAGENVVLVEVSCPHTPEATRDMITGSFSHSDARNPAAVPGGIWRDVWLEIYPGGVAPDQLAVTAVPDLRNDGTAASALVGFTLACSAAAATTVQWTATVAPETWEGPALTVSGSQALHRGLGRLQGSLTIPEPRLWWTWDQGEPELYRLTLEVTVPGGEPLRLEQVFGVRKIAHEDNLYHLNGCKLFLRGGNYLPADLRLARATRAGYERDFDLMRGANLNCMRVTGHIERPEFYELASRRGILLWQDFPLQWGYARSVQPEADRQVGEMVRLLGNWPAIAVWCCHAKPLGPEPAPGEGAAGYRLRAMGWNWNRDALAPALARTVKKLDETRPVVAHTGDGRLQSVAELDRLLKKKRPPQLRLVSEYGTQAFPDAESTRQFVRGQWPRLEWHELTDRYLLQQTALDRNVPPTHYETFPAYIAGTQQYQAEFLKRSTEALRRLKYRPCGGAMAYNFADCSPGVTWSVLDYWRRPKAGYYALRDAFAPVHIMAEWPSAPFLAGKPMGVWVTAVNDSHRPVAGSWRWRVEAPGRVIAEGGGELELPADGVWDKTVQCLLPSDLSSPTGTLVLELEVAGEPPVTNRYDLQFTGAGGK